MSTRTLLTALLLALLSASAVFAQLPSDAEVVRLLVGDDWIAAKQPGLASATTKFKADGTFSGEATFTPPIGDLTVKVEGKWRVERGILIEEVTRSSQPDVIPVGKTTRDTLLSVTQKSYRYRDEQGEEGSCSRAAQDPTPASPK